MELELPEVEALVELASLDAVVSVAEAEVSEAEVVALASVEEAAVLDGLAVPANWNWGL